MAKLIVPVIPVSRSIMERLAKARGNLVQKKVQVKTRSGTHTRMQWVKPENDNSKGGAQAELFDAAGKPNPAAVPVKTVKPKSSDGYKVYHDSFTSVVDEVIKHNEKQGLFMSENDIWTDISTGPGKPRNGRTDRYSLPLFDKDGKPAKKAVHFQVYDMGKGKYELNMYNSPMKESDYTEDQVKIRKEDEQPEQDNSGQEKSPYKVETVDTHDNKEHGVKTEIFKYVDGKNAGKYGVRVIDTDADRIVPSISIFSDEAKARAGFAEAAGIKNDAGNKPAEKKRPSLEDMAGAEPIKDNQIIELEGQSYKIVPTSRGWRVYIGEGKWKGKQRPGAPYADKAKILAEFVSNGRPTVGRMKELISAAKKKGSTLYLTPERAPKYAIGRLEAKAKAENIPEAKPAEKKPEKAVTGNSYDQAKAYLAEKEIIFPEKKTYSSHKFVSLFNDLRQSGAMTDEDVKKMAAESIATHIKSIDTFARRNNNRMPAVDRSAKKKLEKELAGLKNGGEISEDTTYRIMSDAMTDLIGRKRSESIPWHPEDYKFEDESNKKLAEMLSDVIIRHQKAGGELHKSIFSQFREGLAKVFGTGR